MINILFANDGHPCVKVRSTGSQHRKVEVVGGVGGETAQKVREERGGAENQWEAGGGKMPLGHVRKHEIERDRRQNEVIE